MILEPRVLWPVFAGSVFVLMGAALAADARRHASAALEWQKDARPAAPRSVESAAWLYRGFGALFIAGGVSLAAGWARFAPAPDLGPGAGAALVLCGAAFAAFNARRREQSGSYAFVEAELPAQAPSAGRRVAAWCNRLIVGLFIAFGILLMKPGALP